MVAQSCPTLFNRVDCSMPGSSVRGILQARILEWVAMPFSKGSSWPRDWTHVSCIAGRFFTVWGPGEAPVIVQVNSIGFWRMGYDSKMHHGLITFFPPLCFHPLWIIHSSLSLLYVRYTSTKALSFTSDNIPCGSYYNLYFTNEKTEVWGF